MEERISDVVDLKKGYIVNADLLMRLNEIFIKHSSNAKVQVETLNGKTQYRFSSIDEFIDNASKFTEEIQEFSIDVYLPTKKYAYNKIEISLSNDATLYSFKNRIKFNFDDTETYVVIRNSIEKLLKNYEVGYSCINNVPIIPMLSITLFIGISLYTLIKDIVFSAGKQYIITICALLGCVSYVIPSIAKIKSKIFPRNEFSFGVNEVANNKAGKIRSLLGSGILLGIGVGLIVNFLTELLF